MTPIVSGYEVLIYAKGEEDAWNVYARGSISVKNQMLDLPTVGLDELKARCTTLIKVEDFYERVNSGNIHYGKNFKTLDALYAGNQEVLGELTLGTSGKGYLAHPALLEGCLQLLAVTLYQEDSKEIYLPVEFDSFELFSPLGEHIFAHWQETEKTDTGRSGNLKLLDPSGKILATFEGMHYRKTTAHSLKQMLAHELSVDDLIYELTWQEHAVEETSHTDPVGHWLVLSEGEVSKPLIELIESKGGSCKPIKLIDYPKTKEDVIALLQNENPTGILHLVTSETGAVTAKTIREAQRFGAESFLYLTQALIELEATRKIPLILVTASNLINSPLDGLYKTIHVEHPELDIRQIVLEGDWDPAFIISRLWANDHETIVALREGKMYVPRLLRQNEAKAKRHELIRPVDELQLENEVRPDGTYLITGGLGGLGLVLAKWLISKGVKHLVLTGRKANDQNLLKDPEFNAVDITYESLDVSDEQAVENLLKRLTESKNPLKGIFHLAGVLDDATLMEQDWSRFETVFAPKVYGSYYLHKYSMNLDFFVMFSSVSSIWGNPGQSNYAAANAFMDALCHYRKEQGLPALSLSWGPWAEVGMAKDLVARHAKGGVIGLNPKEGMRALEAALLDSEAHLAIANINWKVFLKQMIEVPAWFRAFAEQKTGKEYLSEQLEAVDVGERLIFIKGHVSTVLKEILGLSPSESIDEKKGFADMGLDSLMAVELKNRLQASIGKEAILATTALFDYSSIEKLSQYIAQLLKVENIQVRKRQQALAPVKADEPIAIIGMSCRFPGGANNPKAYWELLHRGGDGISEVPASRWDIDSYYDPDPAAPGKMITKLGGFLDVDISLFDAEFFGISPREAEFMDPQQRLLLELSYEALESADIEPATLQGTQTGVFVGICSHDYIDLLNESGDKALINPYIGTGNTASTATGRISFVFDFQGPNFAVDTACSSSLVAIDQACESLRNGTASLALTGGVNLILAPGPSIDCSKAGMLAPDGYCKTFDANANGYVRGEGCGIIVLKRYSEAIHDGNPILAVIKASGINQDGASSGLTVPNGEAQEALINTVLAKAKLEGSDIDYVEAHGTGTPLGDPIEVRAIGSTYGVRDAAHPLKIGSVKTNIGHLEGAAGIAGVIKAVLAFQNETIPPQLHFNHLNPYIEMNFPVEIVTKNQEWKRGQKTRRAAVSSFGFSGTNAHLIIEEAPKQSTVSAESKIISFLHFNASATGLKLQLQALAEN